MDKAALACVVFARSSYPALRRPVARSGFGRPFRRTLAGAHSLLVSHWEVDDKVTARLMTKVIDYRRRRRLRVLINGKLNPCLDYSCRHGINRRHDNPPGPILSAAHLCFVKSCG